MMPQRPISQVDIAPTVARALGLRLSRTDGLPIDLRLEEVRNIILAIVDSLGYDLYLYLEPHLRFMPYLASHGALIRARSVSNSTSPAIASILSGLMPENHGIFDKRGAKDSDLLSLPEIASSAGLKSAVIMETQGAQVYRGLIDIAKGVSDNLSPYEFDGEICRESLKALDQRPRLMVSYFIGLDKAAHMGSGLESLRSAAKNIDGCLGEIARSAEPGTMMIVCGDHPIHAGPFKRRDGPYCVALILGIV